MAAFPTWLEWLVDVTLGPRAPPKPGTHEADLEELRVGGLARKEASKPPGQRDEAVFYQLCAQFFKLQVANMKAKAAAFAQNAAFYEQPEARQCCAAAGWVQQRVAASYRALHDFYLQMIQQDREELAAAEARRPAVVAAEPTLHLDLSGALQQQPSRLDMCLQCAKFLEQMELAEGSCRVTADTLQESFQRRGMRAAPTASCGTAAAPSAAADVPAGEHGQQQQQQQQQQEQQRLQCGGDGGVVNAVGAPATPKQQPLPLEQQQQQQQQHASSDQQQEQWQEMDAADERDLLLYDTQRLHTGAVTA